MTDRVGLFFQHFRGTFYVRSPRRGGARRADSAGVLPCYIIGESGTLGRVTDIQIAHFTAVWEPSGDDVPEVSAPFTSCLGRPFATNFHQASLMLEILVVMAAIYAIVMASKPRRRRSMGRYIRGNIDINQALGTLASQTGILAASQVVSERTLVSSIDCIYALAGMTAGDNIGPIEVGVAHSDYSLAEVEACLERTNSWKEEDKIAAELSSRLVRKIGVFEVPSTTGESFTLNDGKSIKTKLNWILNAGQGLNFYFYNTGGQPLATTDSNGHVEGHANLWPR